MMVPFNLSPKEQEAVADPWVRIPALAERLGVKEGQDTGEVDFVLADGRKYSVVALINAFLDRIDRAESLSR